MARARRCVPPLPTMGKWPQRRPEPASVQAPSVKRPPHKGKVPQQDRGALPHKKPAARLPPDRPPPPQTRAQVDVPSVLKSHMAPWGPTLRTEMAVAAASAGICLNITEPLRVGTDCAGLEAPILCLQQRVANKSSYVHRGEFCLSVTAGQSRSAGLS